jgi:hypothetical protein
MIDTVYFRQAELLLRVLPLVDREAVFALKGGTAINFFVRDVQNKLGVFHGALRVIDQSTITPKMQIDVL